MDIWDKEKRSAVMAKIRSKDTKPELIVRRYLWSRGYRFRKNVRGLPGTPDIVLKKYRCVIFVNGCFSHGHENCTLYSLPKTNSDFWRKKVARNRERDTVTAARLRGMGWNVVQLWECQLRPKEREKTLTELVATLDYLLKGKPRKKKTYDGDTETFSYAAEPYAEYGE